MILTTQKGRTLSITISIGDVDDDPYTLESGDKIRFGVRSAHADSRKHKYRCRQISV